MERVMTIGLDLAKTVFQVHGVDAGRKVVIRRQLRRGEVIRFFAELPPCLVGMSGLLRSHHARSAHGIPDSAVQGIT